MKTRELWRPGFQLTKGETLTVNNVLRAARRNGDLEFVRRLRSLLLVGNEGYTQESAGKILEATAGGVWRWCAAFRKGGVDALRSRKAPGRKPRLSKEQLARLRRYILRGPELNGFDTGTWTAVLVQALLKKRFKVDFHVTHVRRILRGLGFSVQFPKKILSEANKHQQRRWMEHEYPAIKKKPTRRTRSCSSRTSASSSSKEP